MAHPRVRLAAALAILSGGLLLPSAVVASSQHERAAISSKSRVVYSVLWGKWSTASSKWKHLGHATVQGGMLEVRDDRVIVAPVLSPIGNYAIETKLRVRAQTPNVRGAFFGIFFRGAKTVIKTDAASGLNAGLVVNTAASIASSQAGFCEVAYGSPEFQPEADYKPGNSWHTYRLDVRGNSFRLLIDGQEATRIGPVNDLFSARHVGLVAQFTWLEVGSYRVTTL